MDTPAALRRRPAPFSEPPQKLGPEQGRVTAREDLVHNLHHPKAHITIAIVGKYVDLKEAYKSLHEALTHGGVANNAAIRFLYVNSEEVTAANVAECLSEADGILVPGGFGIRGVEGKISAITYARKNRIPFFGICLGMQLLFDKSYEYGEHSGLGLIPGSVRPLAGRGRTR